MTGAATGAAVTVLPAGALLSGCDVGDPAPPGESPAVDAGADPDGALVGDVRAELDELWALTSALHAAVPSLQPSLEALLAMHVAHREALRDPDGSSAPPAPSQAPRGDAVELWSLVVARERSARRRLAGWAVEARSGTLARVLASMAAGIAAHLAAAPVPQEAR